jgi:DNA-binding MarR family transcriptional regulator
LTELAAALREMSDATVFHHMSIAERLGLHATDTKTMSVLERLGPMSAGEIAAHTGLASASVTNLVDRLEARGLVERAPDPADRRRVIVRVSPDAVAGFAPHFAPMRKASEAMLAGYTLAELKIILDFVRRSAERLRAQTALASRGDAEEKPRKSATPPRKRCK